MFGKGTSSPFTKSLLLNLFSISKLHYGSTNFKVQALHYLQHQLNFQPKAFHIFNKITGKKETIDTLRQGPDSKKWDRAVSNEFGRLATGNKYGVESTDTIEFISKDDIPNNRKVTYGLYRFDYHPLKSDLNCCRLVAGGDKLEYESDPSSPAASILETKILINSVISEIDKNAHFMTLDLKDFFLASPMERPEYMKLLYKHIPDDIRQRYNLDKLVAQDGYIYVKIKKGMYGLKQAAVLAYNQLVKFLAPHGYKPIPHTTGLWYHETCPTKFCLCVDDFGIKYYSKDDADHLIQTLRKYYKLSIDHKGENYCGLTLDWDYVNKHVDISMPKYLRKVLERYQHPPPKQPVYSPHKHNPPVFGQKIQYAKEEDKSKQLDKNETKRIQGIVGSLLYYSRAIDSTMLTALNEISRTQSKPTQKTLEATNQLLDYAATYPDVTVRFHASDMVLYGESDAAYLVLPEAKSRIAGYFYLSNKHSPSLEVPTPP